MTVSPCLSKDGLTSIHIIALIFQHESFYGGGGDVAVS